MLVKRREMGLYAVVAAVWALFAVAIIEAETIKTFLLPHDEVQLADCCSATDPSQEASSALHETW